MTFDIYWSPEGRRIATVDAETHGKAIRKAPQPYRRYLGEMYAVEVKQDVPHDVIAAVCPRHQGGCR